VRCAKLNMYTYDVHPLFSKSLLLIVVYDDLQNTLMVQDPTAD
jgi:hypothetical protein